MKEIKAKKCLTCGRYTLANYKRCSHCSQHHRKSILVDVILVEKE